MNIRHFKPLYWIYNLLHYRQLRHNSIAYRKYNLHKPLVASLSSKDFPDKTSKAWLDLEDSATAVNRHPAFAGFSETVREKLLHWSRDGYMILNGFFSSGKCDEVNAEIDRLMQSGRLSFTYGNKLMFAFKKSPLIKSMAQDTLLKDILGCILDKEVVPFQTINFIQAASNVLTPIVFT